MYKFTILGEPECTNSISTMATGGKRPIFFHKNQKQKDQVVQSLKTQWIAERYQLPQDAEAFEVEMKFYMQPSKENQNLKLWGIIPNTKKKDLDNLEKFYADCLKKSVIKDDALIVSLKGSKYYSGDPRTVITIDPVLPPLVNSGTQLVLDEFSPKDIKRLFTLLSSFCEKWSSLESEPLELSLLDPDMQEMIIKMADFIRAIAWEYGTSLGRIKKRMERV